MPLDFAIIGDGFFAIDRDGDVAYTRNGSFNLDDEGYLCLWGQGRVLNSEGQPIQLPTDHIYVNKLGEIYTEADRNYLGTLGIYATENTEDLERNEYGLFTGGNFQLSENYEIRHRMVERSNVNMVEEMVLMMSSQRALQSAAQMSKIYDAVMSKATTELGRMG